MDDEPTVQPAGRDGGALSVVMWIVVGLAVYVLSVGPVVRFYDTKRPPSSVEKFYTPLIILSDNVRPIGDFFEWYVQLWKPKR